MADNPTANAHGVDVERQDGTNVRPRLQSQQTFYDPEPVGNGTDEKNRPVGLNLGQQDNIGQWAVDRHLEGLLREVVLDPGCGLLQKLGSLWPRNKPGKTESLYCISFAEMQRIYLSKLQVKLVQNAVYMHETKTEPEPVDEWESNLAKYIQALKDYDYMTECSKRPHDFFLVTGERDRDRIVIKKVIQEKVGALDRLRKPEIMNPVEKRKDAKIPIGGTRSENTKLQMLDDLRDRVLLAAIGAFFMLGPMWLMVLHRTTYTGLITTTACVSAFGLLASWRLDRPNDVLSATAAYAAVLVVFVGLTT